MSRRSEILDTNWLEIMRPGSTAGSRDPAGVRANVHATDEQGNATALADRGRDGDIRAEASRFELDAGREGAAANADPVSARWRKDALPEAIGRARAHPEWAEADGSHKDEAIAELARALA